MGPPICAQECYQHLEQDSRARLNSDEQREVWKQHELYRNEKEDLQRMCSLCKNSSGTQHPEVWACEASFKWRRTATTSHSSLWKCFWYSYINHSNQWPTSKQVTRYLRLPWLPYIWEQGPTGPSLSKISKKNLGLNKDCTRNNFGRARGQCYTYTPCIQATNTHKPKGEWQYITGGNYLVWITKLIFLTHALVRFLDIIQSQWVHRQVNLSESRSPFTAFPSAEDQLQQMMQVGTQVKVLRRDRWLRVDGWVVYSCSAALQHRHGYCDGNLLSWTWVCVWYRSP